MRYEILLAAAFPVIAIIAGGCEKKSAPQMPQPLVKVTSPVRSTYEPVVQYVGSVKPNRSVALVARVSGFLTARNFREGAVVAKDSPLYEIEPQQYRIARDQATAELARAEAAKLNAELHFKRVEELRKGNFVSPQDFDQARASRDEAIAAVQGAKASLDQAELSLSYTTIAAPFDGWIGITQYDVGNYLPAPSQTLTTLNEISPVRVEFHVAASRLTETELESLQAGKAPAWRIAFSHNGKVLPQGGVLRYWDNAIDPATGTLLMQALFENKSRALMPGEFVMVHLRPAKAKEGVLLDQGALRYLQGQPYVLTVEPNRKLGFRRVTLGEVVQDRKVVVTSGLDGGERIALGANPRLRPGIEVTVAEEKGNE